MQKNKQPLQRRFIALGDYFYAAIISIRHPAREFQSVGLPGRVIAKAHPLNAAKDICVETGGFRVHCTDPALTAAESMPRGDYGADRNDVIRRPGLNDAQHPAHHASAGGSAQDIAPLCSTGGIAPSH
jgi:hypothetical protein